MNFPLSALFHMKTRVCLKYFVLDCSKVCVSGKIIILFKAALSGLKQFLAAESPLKMMKNDFCFTSKALLVLKIFKFLSRLFGHIVKRLDKSDKNNFKFYDVADWLTNNCNTNIAQYLEKQR